jgi:hypothetical protein
LRQLSTVANKEREGNHSLWDYVDGYDKVPCRKEMITGHPAFHTIYSLCARKINRIGLKAYKRHREMPDLKSL